MRVLILALLCAAATLVAQSEPTFDVASLKRNTSLNEYGGGGPRPGGRYRLTNMPARSMSPSPGASRAIECSAARDGS